MAAAAESCVSCRRLRPCAFQAASVRARIQDLLAGAAERRDKASCVKGGKQRALLAMAERQEAEARELTAWVEERQGQQRLSRQQGHSDSRSLLHGDSAAALRRNSLSERASDSSSVCKAPLHVRRFGLGSFALRNKGFTHGAPASSPSG